MVCTRAHQYLLAVGHGAVRMEVDTVLDQDAGTDARMAANMCTVSDDRCPADAHTVTHYRPLTKLRVTVDPAAMPNPATGTDAGTMLHIRHGANAGAFGHHGPGRYQSTAVGMPRIARHLSGVVFN
jgi:hypothetical protein